MKLVLLGILSPIWIPFIFVALDLTAAVMSLVVSAAFVCFAFREFAKGYV